MFGFLRSWKRRRLAKREPSPALAPLIDQHFPFAGQLDAAERARFLTHLHVFFLEKRFEGAGGLELTDEMKVVVAGSAARLARNLSLDVYDDLVTVVLYPAAWKNPRGEGVHLGEAHQWGLVVLAWDAVRHGLYNPADGHDTALHEFAHVLDLGDGRFDGTPELNAWADYHAWTRVFSRHYEQLRARPHRSQVLRAYGATNEAEFFAVATEAFFEKPARLKEKAPELYEELRRYYRLDPVRNE
ncbi:MAG: zinc-dependent peptidase [Archangium sp.]|nr:zinc-dependent peptidase [Archangium sp.]